MIHRLLLARDVVVVVVPGGGGGRVFLEQARHTQAVATALLGGVLRQRAFLVALEGVLTWYPERSINNTTLGPTV